MPVISSGGRWLTDAKQLLGWAAPNASVLINTVAMSEPGPSPVNPWTYAGYLSEFAVDTTAYASDTYKTCINISGKGGWFYSFVGPVLANATDTLTVRITIDGIATTKTVTGSGTSLRAGVGAIANTQAAPVASQSIYTASQSRLIGPNSMYILTPVQAHFYGSDRIRFENSLKVESKITNAQSTTTNNERYSACIYLTDS